jgi:5S rRNA maturation endonuclease (ribonuclease M5)
VATYGSSTDQSQRRITAEEIAHALDGKKIGDGWKARCPAHHDANPSLSINEGSDGKVLVRCHGPCTQEAVINALKGRGLWGNGGNGSQPRRPNGNGSARASGNVVDSYDYRARHGEHLYYIDRYENKDFRRRPAGGRVNVLYHWPELVAAGPDATLFVCEGEKDAKRVESLGFVATTVAHGSWKGVDVKDIAGRDVIILEDADEPGIKKALASARALRGVAKTIRIVRLPGHEYTAEKHGKDVSDWLDEDEGRGKDAVLAACLAAPLWSGEAFTLEDFRAYMPAHQYICMPTGELWPAASVDAKLPRVDKLKASTWLDKNQSVEQMTWAPGLPTLIQGKTVTNGGWADKHGYAVYNLYKPPTIAHGDADEAAPWTDHVHKVYPADAEHIINYLAHRVQRPHEKINHGLVLGGAQGVGKDTILEPVKRAVGPWNVHEISPQQVLGRFNGFVKSVILRISEARDLGKLNRFAFYEHMKIFLAAPPDVIHCDEKNLREYSVFNVVGVIITSNRKDSFYLPADDRRHYVAWTDLTQADFPDNYWDELWGWYKAGGDRHVAAYLAALDLKGFNPKAPPPKTDTFWEIVDTNRAPENSELADAIDKLGNPNAVTLSMIRSAVGEFSDWLSDRRNARQVPHRMSECGYVLTRNEAAKDGQWVVDGKRQSVYAKTELSPRDRHAAAWTLAATQQDLRG